MPYSYMWTYWRDKKGLREAVEQYPEAKNDPVIAAAIADYDRAHAALDALMTQHDERESNAGLS